MTARELDARHRLATLRETEVGPIPFDWSIVQLGEITDPERPISYGIVQTGPRVHNGIPCLRVVDIQDGQIQLDELITTSNEIGNAYKRTKLRKGDLVVPLRGKVGECAQVPGSLEGANLTRGVALVAVLPQSSSEYCKQFFSASRSRTRLCGSMNGSALQEVPIATLRAFKIALPPSREEQVAIAEALTDADALIDSLEQLLIKKREIKQGAMQELLTGRRRLPGFSGEWVEVALATLLESRPDYGINAAAVRYRPSLPTYLRITDIDGDGRFLADPPVSVDRPDAALYYLTSGDVVFARTGASVGKSYLYRESDGPLVFAGFLIRTRPCKGKLIAAYLFYFSQTRLYGNWVSVMSMRSGQPGINGQELATMPMVLPPLNEQHAIATVLADADADIDAVECRLTKARALKQAVAQALLTGRIRLLGPAA